MAEYEVLDAHPDRKPGSSRRRRLVGAVLVLGLVAALAVALPWNEYSDADPCRERRGVSWCTVPSATLTDAALVRLVHDYCPRLHSLPLDRVVPQPMSLLGLPARKNELALRTRGPGGVVESVLLGQPGRLAWVARRANGEQPWRLQVLCHDGTGDLPVLMMDGSQLRSTLQAATGGRRLDLREAAGAAARALRGDLTGHVSLGGFRCRTGRTALSLQAGARFSCVLRVFTDTASGTYRLSYRIGSQPPYARLTRT